MNLFSQMSLDELAKKKDVYRWNKSLIDSVAIDTLSNTKSIISLKVKTLNCLEDKCVSKTKISTAFYRLDSIECFEAIAYNLGQTTFNFSNFFKLKVLTLMLDSLVEVPDDIKNCRNLQSLNLSFNKFEKLPSWLFGIQGVIELNVSNIQTNNRLKLPKKIKSNQFLLSLNLSNSNIEEIPRDFLSYPNLQILNLSNNKLVELPSSLSGLTKVTELDLTNTLINEIPHELKQMASLRILKLKGTKIKEIPRWVIRLPNLQELTLPNEFVEKHESMVGFYNQLNIKVW